MEATKEMIDWVKANSEMEDITLNFEYEFDLSMSEAEKILDEILEAVA